MFVYITKIYRKAGEGGNKTDGEIHRTGDQFPHSEACIRRYSCNCDYIQIYIKAWFKFAITVTATQYI